MAGDHGQGLGDHGEALHGNLLYQGVVRVPLMIIGSGIPAGQVDVNLSALAGSSTRFSAGPEAGRRTWEAY